jgi:hypothetical protein
MTIKNQLQHLLDIYALEYTAQNAEGCASCFAEEGELHSSYARSAYGRAEVEALHRRWLTEWGGNKSLTVLACGGSDGLAWCAARFDDGAESGTSPMVFEDGPSGWLIRACSLNADIGG